MNDDDDDDGDDDDGNEEKEKNDITTNRFRALRWSRFKIELGRVCVVQSRHEKVEIGVIVQRGRFFGEVEGEFERKNHIALAGTEEHIASERLFCDDGFGGVVAVRRRRTNQSKNKRT